MEDSMKLTVVVGALIGGALCLCANAQAASESSPIVGTWTITNPENQCMDVYTFHSDGNYTSTSGLEVVQGTYTISAPSDKVGRFKVTRTVRHNNGGKDCAGGTENNTGKVDTRYIMFHPEVHQMAVCFAPDTDECFGPLTRVKP
jgi:hypothetical protein